jgi:phospholipid/cholesterol/gamma-HCH transport system permease protein
MTNQTGTSTASVQTLSEDNNTLRVKINGRLDAYTTASAWTESVNALTSAKPANLIVDAGGVEYCDASGIALFIKLRLQQEKQGGVYSIQGLSPELEKLYDLFDPEDFKEDESAQEHKDSSVVALGKESFNFWEELRIHIEFMGKLTVALIKAAMHPFKIRWQEVLLTSEKFGANSVLIIALVNFLVGLVIAFQSAIPMQTYGAEIFVADLVVIAYFKELGPLMTAFVVNGRSGSAFAAELGTMKVNEELDALDTMGLDPVPFLVIPKVISAIFMLPLLTVFGNLFGLLGALVVMLSLGFTFQTFLNQITTAATYGLLLSGLFKTLFFAFLIAGVGCLAGMRATRGPSAVGDAATKAVVIGIVLMILVDGIFGVIYYILGI